MRPNSYMIKEIIDNMNEILAEAKRIPHPKPLSEEEKARGLHVSKQGSTAPDEVPMTPVMSEILRRTREKTDDEWRLKTNDPETKAESWVQQVVDSLLREYNGKETDSYDESLPIDSVELYNAGCWRSRKSNMRDVGNDQDRQREEVAQAYGRELKALNLIDKLSNDIVFQKAVTIVCNLIPEVKANNDFTLVSQPFMNKDSNVSYPFWRNDRAIDPKTGKTYGQLCIELAKRVGLKNVYQYNYTTMFGRNQKLKGRLICAVSRVVNILFNQLESEEIKAYKEKSPLFVGYKDDAGLKEALISMRNDAAKLGLRARNVDQTKFDLHVNPSFLILVGAISMLKANGAKSREIALKRAALATKTWLVDGLSNEVYKIYGRIFSGYIDTNRGGGLVNAIAVLYAIMKQDKNYSDYVYLVAYIMLVMGDDNLFLYKELDYSKFKDDLASIGFEVNSDKDEYGLFFLQYRLFRYNDKDVMAYPWPRVLRSMLFKETKKGLGKYGWTLAWWQQISKVVEYKPSLEILVNFMAYFDKEKLCLDMPVKELINRVNAEDEEAKKMLKTSNARSKFVSTWDKLNDGDPSKARFNKDNVGYLDDLQKAMREVYNPNFFNDHHLPNLPSVD